MHIWASPFRADPIPYRLLALGAVLASVFVPVHALDDGPVTCPFRALAGVPCPACGLMRSLVAVFHLDLDRSLALHALGPVVAVALLAFALGVDRRFPVIGQTLRRPPVAVTLVALWLGAWVARLAAGAPYF